MTSPSTGTRWTEALLYAVTAVVTGIATYIALALWRADLRVPLSYAGDALPTGAHFKTVIEEGWYEHQPRLGAPTGQFYSDFPTADNLHMIAAKIISLFTSDWAVALNVYFLIGFPLAALAAVWFLRVCGVSRALTMALATLYAIAPYHFQRGQDHLWLGSYYAVPLAMGLLVLILQRRRIWGVGRSQNPVLRWVVSPSTRTVVWIALLATSSSYYAVFFLVLLAFTGIVVLIRDRRWKPFLGAAGAGVLTVVVMLVNMAPDILFGLQHGANGGGLERMRAEAEIYALKLSQLLLPWPGHRIGPLQTLRDMYDSSYPLLSEQPALGSIAALGLVSAFILLAVQGILRRGRGGWLATRPGRTTAWLASLLFVAFLFGTVGGLSTVVSFFTSSLRGWNRIVIVMAILALAVVGLLVDAIIRRAVAARGLAPAARRTIAAVSAGVVLVVGFVDQTPSFDAFDYEGNATRFSADAEWFGGIESTLESGSEVLLLPYIPFPENSGPTGFLASEQLIPYLQTDELRWSNGGIKGRPAADWPGQLQNYPADDLADLTALAGFSAIVVERNAYVDHGAAIEAALTASTGIEPEVSANTNFAFYDLREYTASVAATTPPTTLDRARELITEPVTPYPSPGFGAGFDEDGGATFGTGRLGGAFTIANDTGDDADIHLSFSIAGPIGAQRALVTLPDGRTQEVPLVDGVGEVSVSFTAAPGSFPVGIDFDGGEVPLDGIVLSRVVLVQDELVQMLDAVRP
ncbi:hypothetical protein [Agromyces sp. LHK192]|uniref:hypothetical protein n=1 Tax=Agromyces sp. LHK192 TaxID=2498704 RepID=UPI000FD94F79|nr:hypothetical protein [Agromyces sp. LHK192]